MNFILAFINLFSITAFAQNLDVHGFQQSPGDGDALDHLSTWQSEQSVAKTLTIEPLLEYAEKPLVLHQISDGVHSTKVLVDDLVVLNVGAFYSPTKKFGVALSAPFYLSSQIEGEFKSVGLGDVSITTPITLSKSDDLFNFSLIPLLKTPGLYKDTLSSDSFSGGLILAGSFTKEKFDISLNLGAIFKPEVDFYNLKGKEHLISNVGFSYLVTDSMAVGMEILTEPSLEINNFVGTESPAEAMVTLRSKKESLGWTVGVSKALNRGVSAATWRVLSGVSFTFDKRKNDELISVECETCTKEVPLVVEYTEPESVVKIEGDRLILLKPIYFDFDKTEIRFPDSQQVMSDLVKVLLDHPEITLLRVATGTDPRGTSEYNYSLSLRRAESVVQYLVEHGVSKERLVTFGYGESKLPMGNCSTEECYEKDRFAEFSILQIQE